MMLSRRTFLVGGAASVFLGENARWASASDDREVQRAIAAAQAANNAWTERYLKDNPVGYDRLWLRRNSGEEIIAIYRDYGRSQALVPQQCLMLSYFWRDVNDRGVAVAISAGLFDVMSRVQTVVSTMAGRPTPIILTSGYRTPEHNAKLEGAAVASEHLHGRAGDSVMHGIEPGVVGTAGARLGAGGVGVYKTFTHLDVGQVGRRWNGKV